MKRYFTIVLFVLAGAAVGYWIYATFIDAIDGFYTVTDSFLDSNAVDVADISFVQIEAYDSSRIKRVAEKLTDEMLEGGKADVNKHRTFLYHFYVQGDTASLNEDMVDELAYSHPSLMNAEQSLLVVPGGYIVKVSFRAKATEPDTTELIHTQFYMPRGGVKAKDLR